MTCAVETVEARPVGVLPGRGQRACQAAGRASDLQPSIGRGRSRRREPSRVGLDCVPKRVKATPPGVRVRFRSRTAFVNTFVCVRLCSFAHTHPAPHPVHELLLFMNVRLRSFAPRDQGCSKTPGGASPTSRASRVTLTTTHIEGLEGRHRGASRGCIKGSIEGCRGRSSVRASRAIEGWRRGCIKGWT